MTPLSPSSTAPSTPLSDYISIVAFSKSCKHNMISFCVRQSDIDEVDCNAIRRLENLSLYNVSGHTASELKWATNFVFGDLEVIEANDQLLSNVPVDCAEVSKSVWVAVE